jgi:hypothetical protein
METLIEEYTGVYRSEIYLSGRDLHWFDKIPIVLL